jgi:outer membrane lipoprotein
MKKIGLLITVVLVMQGCSYAISSAMADKADKKITFAKLRADPDSFKGKIVILGGTIDQVTNLKQGGLIEVVQKDLDYWGKPRRTKTTGGRFLVLYPRYLNPLVYEPGRDITVAAEVEGTSSNALEDRDYGYVIVISKELKLWERERQTWDKPQWLDPLYDRSSSPGRRDY